VLRRYSDVRAGHLPDAHPAAHGAVAAVPIWWRGEVLGVNVAFAGEDRRFSTVEVDRLEVLSQVGAAGIASAAVDDSALSVLLSGPAEDQPGPAEMVVTQVGPSHHRNPRTTSVAKGFVASVQADLRVQQQSVARLRVVLLHQADHVRVLLHDEHGVLSSSSSPHGLQELHRSWSGLVSPHGGVLQVEQVPGWGVLVLADLPHAAGARTPSTLSGREREVLSLLARGLTDRQVAQELVLAHKTVEKHVGAVLRKTGTTSRTAAVIRALEEGWLPPVGRHAVG
jgi:DNA-binding NarL/FixJ family response regulator